MAWAQRGMERDKITLEDRALMFALQCALVVDIALLKLLQRQMKKT